MNSKSAKMIVVGVVVLLVASVFLLSKKEEKQSPASLQDQETKTQTTDTQEPASSDNQANVTENTTNTPSIAKTETGETANWKTYSSSKYGFTIKYPEKWYVFPDEDFISWSNYPKMDYTPGDAPSDWQTVSMGIDKTDKSLNDYIISLGHSAEIESNKTESKVQGKDIIRYSVQGDGPEIYFAFIKLSSDSVMEIQTSKENSKMLDLMVSTLEFTK